MTSPDHNLRKIMALARQAQPVPDEPRSRDDVRLFAQRTVADWSRRGPRAAPPDGLRLWERVGVWSLATAAAVVFLAALYQAAPPAANPFDPFGPEAAEEPFFF